MIDAVTLPRPCVVLGSAPQPHVPSGAFDVMCVNSSGYAARDLGLPEPAITVLAGFKLIYPNREEDRQALRGLRTKTLLLVDYLLPLSPAETAQLLADLDFRYERLETVDFHGRARVIESATGLPLASDAAPELRVSNGIFATCHALQLGAPAVIVSGFSLTLNGHFYSQRGRPRRHIGPDTTALQALRERGWPLYTTETDIADATGIPLWTTAALDSTPA